MQVDTFGAYVRAELEHWGREYALHRDCDYLGHRSKNVLQLLIEHKGDMPGRAQGFKPFESDCRAQMVEDFVSNIARDNLQMACALRGYYCGVGRRKVERFETAIVLMQKCDVATISVRQYMTLVDMASQRVRGYLEGLSWSHLAA